MVKHKLLLLLKKIGLINENKILLKRIYKIYKNSENLYECQFASFIKNHLSWSGKLYDVDYAPSFVFGGEWTLEYLDKDYEVDYSDAYPCVQYHGKKLYMPLNMSKGDIVAYLRSIEIEQDSRSAHCYFPYHVEMRDKVIVDIGGAEGNFVLDHIDEISKAYIFETDDKWIIPLSKTFEPWKEKVKIIQRFVGDGTNETIRLDDYFSYGGGIDIIKMDVEGAEAMVLKGSQRIIETHKELTLLICLYHSGNNEQEIKSYLEGYECKCRPGCMFYLWERPLSEPYLRKGVAEFWREFR